MYTRGRLLTSHQRKHTEEVLKKKREGGRNLSLPDLEEANAALKVLLRRLEEDKKALEDAILANAQGNGDSLHRKVEGRPSLSEGQKTLLGTVESNLNDIISPFLQKIAASYAHLHADGDPDCRPDERWEDEQGNLGTPGSLQADGGYPQKQHQKENWAYHNKEVNLQAYLEILIIRRSTTY